MSAAISYLMKRIKKIDEKFFCYGTKLIVHIWLLSIVDFEFDMVVSGKS